MSHLVNTTFDSAFNDDTKQLPLWLSVPMGLFLILVIAHPHF